MRIKYPFPQLHHSFDHSAQAGFTLLELLLYVALVGGLLTLAISFYGTAIDARIKNQSIVEVNDQGTALMDHITQIIRSASSITSPTAGTSAASLTLVVPTGALSPTIFSLTGSTLGYTTIGATTDTDDSNSMNATKFTAGATGTISTLYAYVSNTLSASPNNLAQMAIYSGTTAPTTLLASSASVTLTGGAWNAFPINAVNVTSGQTYWLAYNTNGLSISANNLQLDSGTTNQSIFTSQTFGSWPASWTGTGQNIQCSVYAPIDTGGSTAAQIKEGSGSAVSLTNNLVQVSGLTFQNLSRPSTPGSVQVSFTVSRLNPNNRNEFNYQRTFTGTAEVAW